MHTEEARSVLETLARSFTDHDNLSVAWDSFPCTDFKKIYVQKSETIVPGVECTPGELWLSRKASVAHESAHLLFTDEKDLERLFAKALLKPKSSISSRMPV